jgi:hypothetical protein
MIVCCKVVNGERPQCAWWGGDRAETNDVHGPGGGVAVAAMVLATAGGAVGQTTVSVDT